MMEQMERSLGAYGEACGTLLLELQGDAGTRVTGVTQDSRAVRPGMLFMAIRGEKADGRRFIEDAVARGASAVAYQAVERWELPVPGLRVAHDYRAFGLLAACAYDWPGAGLQVLAVTGTNGKTTSAYLLRDILRRCGRRVGMIGTVEYDFGAERVVAERTTPTALELQGYLARMRAAGLEAVVMEASSHALDQGRLGGLAVDGALWTNLSGDHLDYHETMGRYFAAKQRLFTERLARRGVAVVNTEDAYGRRLATELAGLGLGARLVTTALERQAALRPTRLQLDMGGITMRLSWEGVPLTLRSTLTGRFNAENLIGAAGLALALGADRGDVARAVQGFAGVPGRLERVDAPGRPVVLVDYAHTDDALARVCAAVKPLCRGRLWVVFGCGGDRDRTKRPRMAAVAAEYGDAVVITSDNPRTEDPQRILGDILSGLPEGRAYTAELDRRAAIRGVLAAAGPADTVLIAGKGHEDYQEVNGVKYPFHDPTVVRELLAELG